MKLETPVNEFDKKWCLSLVLNITKSIITDKKKYKIEEKYLKNLLISSIMFRNLRLMQIMVFLQKTCVTYEVLLINI